MFQIYFLQPLSFKLIFSNFKLDTLKLCKFIFQPVSDASEMFQIHFLKTVFDASEIFQIYFLQTIFEASDMF